MTRLARWSIAAATLAALCALVPATADWLVTREGARIETDGPWRVESRLVVFKRPEGTFASLRLSDVDLEASERLTREMAEAARRPREEPPETASRQATVRLTEKDLPPVQAEPAPAAGPEEATEEPEESLRIIEWREVGGPDRQGIDFVGDVRNVSEHAALGVEVLVTVYDENGEEIQSRNAVLTSSGLPAGQAAGFRASFPGVYHYARVEFRASGQLTLSGDGTENGDGDTGR